MIQRLVVFLVILVALALGAKCQNRSSSRRPANGGGGGPYRPSYGSSNQGRKEFEIFHEWKELDFEFPSHHDRMYALSKGLYTPGNSVPIDVAVNYRADHSCRVFVTIPRFTTGIPVTLATVSNTKGPGGPKLKPYPYYSVHSSHGADCDGITSVFRVSIDECDRMWVVDTGRIGSVQHCAPQLLVFDLRTDTLIHRYRFPQSQYKTGVSLFVTPIVDVRDPPPTGHCVKTKLYIADVTGFGLIVYDTIKNRSWRVQNKLMYPDPDYGTFTIAGESFDLMDGIIGMDVTPKHQHGERHLYFHSLANSVENVVPLSVLDNEENWLNDSDSLPRSFRTIGDRHIQSVAEAMDSKGNLFFGIMNPIGIAYWNINTPYNSNSIKLVAQNDKTLQFASGVKIVKNKHGREELWISTNRFQKIASGTKNSNEINYRIQRCYVDDLLNSRAPTCGAGTCSSPNYNVIPRTEASDGGETASQSVPASNSNNLVFV